MSEAFWILLKKTSMVFVDVVLLSFIFVYLNMASIFVQFPDVTMFTGQAWKISTGCVLASLVMAFILRQQGKIWVLLRVLKRSFWLILFIAFATLSLAWSVDFSATMYELMLLFFATFSALYFAVRFGLSGLINLLLWIGAFCVLISLFIVFFTPFGIMWNEPFVGSWHGLFWHRNHAGSLMAFFNMAFLLRFLLDIKLKAYQRMICVFFYILTVIHVFGSRSATGIALYIFLNLASGIIWFWLNFHQKIGKRHYQMFALAVIIGLVLFFTNLEFFFGLLGRSANMTGRTPLWKDLFFNFYLARPLLGHGYGAIWMQESFRVLMQARHAWKYPVCFADNGFLDILLNLGGVGLGLFLAIFLSAVYESVKKIKVTYSWRHAFILMIFLYVVVGNLTYSFLLEIDHFVWTCFIASAFVLRLDETPPFENLAHL